MVVIIMSYFVFRSQETVLVMCAQTPLYDSSQNERRTDANRIRVILQFSNSYKTYRLRFALRHTEGLLRNYLVVTWHRAERQGRNITIYVHRKSVRE